MRCKNPTHQLTNKFDITAFVDLLPSGKLAEKNIPNLFCFFSLLVGAHKNHSLHDVTFKYIIIVTVSDLIKYKLNMHKSIYNYA